MGTISWKTVFKPTFNPGGLSAATYSVTGRIFDDFEGYANNAALAAVWSLAGGGGGDAVVLSSVANALHQQQSMEIALTGGPATLTRTINNNFFRFPSRQIRYILFRGIVSTGTSTIRVRLGNAANTIYREWQFTLGTSTLQEHIIDIDSASAGYQNEEGYSGPIATLGTWDPTVINTFSFRSLSSGSTYRFDDIKFSYTYSIYDLVGFGTEPATDDGADGSLHSKIRYLNNIVLQLIGSTSQYNKYGPADVRLNNSFTWGLELKGMAEQGIPSTTEITPGNYTIDRVRNGTTTNIVASTGATEAAGFISATYTPLEDNWQLGDELLVTFSGGRVDSDTDTAITPTSNIGLAATSIELANAALFQTGQRIRIYDDLTTEYNSVIAITDPTHIQITATANAYTAANNFRVVLVERNELQTARFAANINYTPEITKEVEYWTLADYDDFDFADADGNNERWDTGYIANTSGSAAGTEGGTANINTSVAGNARVRVDPDATPTQAAYAIKRDEPFRSKYYTVIVDADVTLDTTQATATFAGLRISAGDADDPANYVIIARESSSAVNRISSHAEFNNVAQPDINFSTTDNAVAFKIERYGNVWSVFYSLTQYPNWIWVKLTQYEDANGDMTSITSAYLYAESAGTVDAQVATGDFDNWKYYIGSGSIEQILSSIVLGGGTFTTSSATVPADTGRTESDNYWNGVLIIPVTGALAFQPRVIVDFANAGGVFSIDPEHPFTAAPAVGDEYILYTYQAPLVSGANSTRDNTVQDVVGAKADTADYTTSATNNSLMRLLKGLMNAVVIGEGTLTTSSTTVPADTGRTEVNNYWSGSWLLPVTGVSAFQPRLITSFANVGGVFTLDAQQPFTTAPGTVAYVLLAPNSQLVPAADATTNTTPAHVLGNKSDAALVTASSASVIARLRAIEAALSVNAAGGGEFELDGVPDLWDALVTDSSAQADIVTLTGNRDASVIQRLAALINALQITDAGTATGFEEDGTGGRLWESLTAAKGTFTTSSATLPADTGRTEANDYFNGDIIIPLSGAIVRQARVIVDFTNVGGVFTLDPQLPFTAVPGLVDYVIIHFGYSLVPAVDATSNLTEAHVIGNKTETIPAMTAAPVEGGATTSLVALTKAIMERVGATPADPDDSILTNIGQRDDTATADTLADITTTSIQAKLRRLLLRFSADAFSSTVQGVARTDVENMIQGLANYLSSAGATWSVAANPGAAAKDNLEQTLEDFADLLAGTTGVVTFPVRAVAANGVSLAEVLRHVTEAVGEDTADNAFASTNVVSNRDGSALERLEFIFSSLGMTSSTTTALGTTTTFIDTARTEANDYWNGKVYFVQTSGANIGLASRVVDFDAVTDTGTLEPALPNAVASGVTYVLIAFPNNYELGDDNANNAFASTNIVANEDGSILERLEQVQEATNRGTGTSIAANRSLVDALGTDGTTVNDTAVSVLGAIGADNANNAFASTSIAENGDGSVLERLEEIRGRSPASSTFILTNAMGTAVQTISDISPIRHGRIAIEFDINTLIAAAEGGTVIFRLQNMIDGVTLRTIDRTSFIVGTDEVHPTVSGWVQEGTTTARVTIQVNSAVTVNRNIIWRIIESS